VEGTTFPTAFIGDAGPYFISFSKIPSNSRSNHLCGHPADMHEKDCVTMIELTRLNGNLMLLNSDLIKTAEASPDTMLTLINGEKLIVREELSEVLERVLHYRARLLAMLAHRLSSDTEMQLAASLTSTDIAGGCVRRNLPEPSGDDH
jgi:flagellar protein FlbD